MLDGLYADTMTALLSKFPNGLLRRELFIGIVSSVSATQARLNLSGALVGARSTSSVSAFVQHAVAVSLNDVTGWGALLASALDQTGGQLTRAERTWADDVLLKPPDKRRGKRARTRAA